jgi:hypothetical protein
MGTIRLGTAMNWKICMRDSLQSFAILTWVEVFHIAKSLLKGGLSVEFVTVK